MHVLQYVDLQPVRHVSSVHEKHCITMMMHQVTCIRTAVCMRKGTEVAHNLYAQNTGIQSSGRELRRRDRSRAKLAGLGDRS